jgi:prepilin-type N-terminal cleavage/methylation domain-containing protein
MRTSSHRQNGFSLVELMVVMTVFGLLLAIIIPTIGTYQRSARLAGAANTLEADLHQARAMANARRLTYQVLFAGSSYAVTQGSPPVTIRTRAMPRGVACTASDTATFYAWGLTEPITITVADDRHSRVMQLSGNGRISRD